MRVLDYTHSILFNLLNCAVRENALLLTIGKETLNCTVWEAYLLRAIREVLLNLVVLKLKDLEAVRESRLRCLGFVEKVDDFASRKGLFYVLILEKDNLVAIRPNLSLHSVRENYLFLSALEE